MSRKRRVQPVAQIHHAHDSTEVLKMERLLLFTDAVFAIILTLLALEVRLPENANLHTAQGVVDALVGTTGRLAAYVLSFVVIAMIWNTHLRRYRYLTAVSGEVVGGNLLQLMLTGLIPFATSMIARSVQPLAIAFYAGTIALNILVGWVTWRFAISDPHRVSQQYTTAERREGDWRSLSTAAIFAVSIPMAFVAPVPAELWWAAQIPANLLIRRFVMRR
jgi:uncharacterized membrane protein